MTACTETKLEMLSDPQNIQVEKRVITWDPVENASGYLVTFAGEEFRLESTQLDIHQYMEEGTYLFTLIALGDGEQYANSVMVQESIALESVIQHGFDDLGFEYIFLKDAMGYEVNQGGADLSGMVTIPDFYGDYPVVRIAERMFRTEGAYTHWTKYPNCFTERYCNTITTGIKLPANLENIGAQAFAWILNLEKIEIPETVATIEAGAFEGCKRLKKVNIPLNLKEIPHWCFRNTALSEIVLPASLEVIGDDAFSSEDKTERYGPDGYVDSALAEIVIPASVKHIGIRAFEGRRNLKTVILKDNIEVMLLSCFDDTAWLTSQSDGFVYLKDYLYCYKGEMPENAKIEIPAGTKGIVQGAFKDQENLREVVIPEGIVFFGGGIFTRCSALATVTLPSDMKEIPTGMFGDCTSLKSITLPEGLTFIGSGAFSGSGLESITIPGSVKSILGAFRRCKSLREIRFPSGVETLGTTFLQGCSALETVLIPQSVKEIDSYPFYECDALTHIFYEGSSFSDLIKKVKNIDEELLALLEAAPIYCYSETAPTEPGNYWHYVDGIPTPWESEE